VTANTLRLIVEPDEGVAPVRELIDSAQTSLLIKQFTFTEPSLIQAVIDRRRAGVNVRVMLNAARSGGDRANDETYAQFEAADIAVQWASPNFYVTHEKSVVVDEEVALLQGLMSLVPHGRWLLHTAMVERLCGSCEVLLINCDDAYLMTPGVQHFQRLLGYEIGRLRFDRTPSPRRETVLAVGAAEVTANVEA